MALQPGANFSDVGDMVISSFATQCNNAIICQFSGNVYTAPSTKGRAARNDFLFAYSYLTNLTCTKNFTGDIIDMIITPGVYCGDFLANDNIFGVAFAGNVTFDNQGDPNALFIFKTTQQNINHPGFYFGGVNFYAPNEILKSNVYFSTNSKVFTTSDNNIFGTFIGNSMLQINGNVMIKPGRIYTSDSSGPSITGNFNITVPPSCLQSGYCCNLTFCYTTTDSTCASLTGTVSWGINNKINN